MSEEKKENTTEEVKEETKPEEEVEEKPKEEVKKEDSKKEKEDSKIKELEAQIAKLKSENEDLIKKNEVLKNEYARAYADTENIRRRLNSEFELNNKYRAKEFALEVLPVLDNCERALALTTDESTDDKYRKGFEMVHKQLLLALKKEGVEEIDCLNKPFDPNFHQAMMSEHVDGVEANTVTAVLQKGYMLKDRLLRAAMVKVSE